MYIYLLKKRQLFSGQFNILEISRIPSFFPIFFFNCKYVQCTIDKMIGFLVVE